MNDHHAKVIIFPAREGGSWGSTPGESLRDAVEEFSELERCLLQLAPQRSWSAQRWMIASTPFRMLLIGASKRLKDLRDTNPADGQTTMSWAFELNDACLETERCLNDIDVCLDMLQRPDASFAERAREIEMFASSRSMLLKALGRIRYLTTRDFTAELGENLGDLHQ